eukprot:ctg_544.g308
MHLLQVPHAAGAGCAAALALQAPVVGALAGRRVPAAGTAALLDVVRSSAATHTQGMGSAVCCRVSSIRPEPSDSADDADRGRGGAVRSECNVTELNFRHVTFSSSRSAADRWPRSAVLAATVMKAPLGSASVWLPLSRGVRVAAGDCRGIILR